ncbi:hypothetical protein AWR36_005775 [Microbulbifer flavimaris]|uniref:Transglutaminase-like domain-containing protein n=1 Tax=Microbulbifer flavimaris TaxID=1781068 RepID=A0ABX4HZH1_9GAMM|nr:MULTISPECIES: tetratricopeptide repeat protein [Microbulbifer]PCO05527.1 hypothetical protein AWR36_005775 [Microbulbifer flavimaris]
MKAPVTLVLAALLLSACTTTLPTSEAPLDVSAPLSGSALLGEPVDPAALPDMDLLSLTPEIRELLAGVAPGRSPHARLAALIRAFDERSLHVNYEADATLTAAQTFHQQRGNCLAFTLMMVAMARELGADAYFNEVDVPPVWDSDDDQTFVVYRHINMVSESRRGRRVVDFNMEAYDPLYDQRRLDDREAFAQFYSNRGVELMQVGQMENAFLHLRKALDLKPGSADLWANLGALYSRAGHRAEAESSYRQALALNSGHLVAISNLERLYRAGGRTQLAETYAARARYHRARNPYYLYQQAREAYEVGQYEDAKKQLKKALRQYQDDHRFHFLMGLTNLRLGDTDSSKDSLRTAFALTKTDGARAAYLRKLQFLKEESLAAH